MILRLDVMEGYIDFNTVMAMHMVFTFYRSQYFTNDVIGKTCSSLFSEKGAIPDYPAQVRSIL